MNPKKQSKKILCCEICQDYWVCEKKWYLGEKGQESVCCDFCSHFSECRIKSPAITVKK